VYQSDNTGNIADAALCTKHTVIAAYRLTLSCNLSESRWTTIRAHRYWYL